jgi:hypothetical protein
LPKASKVQKLENQTDPSAIFLDTMWKKYDFVSYFFGMMWKKYDFVSYFFRYDVEKYDFVMEHAWIFTEEDRIRINVAGYDQCVSYIPV